MMQTDVANLQAFFPELSESALRKALAASNGNADQAASLLLEATSLPSSIPVESKTISKVFMENCVYLMSTSKAS